MVGLAQQNYHLHLFELQQQRKSFISILAYLRVRRLLISIPSLYHTVVMLFGAALPRHLK